MKSVEMDIKVIEEAVTNHLLNEMSVDFYSDETCDRMNALDERLSRLPFIDEKFGVQLSNDIHTIVNVASDEGFTVGFQTGLSMVKALLMNEMPTFNIITKKHTETTTHKAPSVGADCADAFKKYMSSAADKLTEEELWRLIGRTEALIERHRNETDSLF